jgi:hypothetical protein
VHYSGGLFCLCNTLQDLEVAVMFQMWSEEKKEKEWGMEIELYIM